MTQKILNFLIDLRFAIFLLIVLCIILGIGSVIEQDQTQEYYKENYNALKPFFGFLSYKFIFMFQLNTVYKSYVFLTFIFLLGLSLFLCTFKTQFPNLRFAKKIFFIQNSENFSLLPFKKYFIKKKFFRLNEKTILFFTKKKFFVHQQKNILYALKGILGKIGPIFVHFSLICILLGSINGALGKFVAQEFIAKGEIIHTQNILRSSWFCYFPKFSIRLNDFWIEYKNQKLDQFYSDLSILNNLGEEIYQNTISVNKPLNYKSFNCYQIDWELLGIRIKNHSNSKFQYPLSLIKKTPKLWVSYLYINDLSDGRIILLDEFKHSAKIYNNFGNFVTKLNFGETFFIKNKNYILLDLISETGIQIKYDPSIPLIFTGFGTLMISTFLSYQTYTKIWLLIKPEKIILGGQTTRSKSSFEIEFKKFEKIISYNN
jgi:cytochrome c biogenesis protein